MTMVYGVSVLLFERKEAEDNIQNFHVIGRNFWDALDEIEVFLDKEIGEDKWEILALAVKPDINIVNGWNEHEDHSDCDGQEEINDNVEFLSQTCEHCQKINTVPSGMDSFTCGGCGKKNPLLKEDDRNKENQGGEEK